MNTFDQALQAELQEMFAYLEARFTSEEVARIRLSYEFAREAHATQFRKTGQPYIMHPVAVARIMAEEFQMGVNPIMAAFLHDVVEDTPHTIEDIREHFGEDVAFLVQVVTKKKCHSGDHRKQENNFKQLLESLHYDIRAVMVKLADRLHNMRTLDSMKIEKQMKIAGETDFFYAPFANRLGLHNVRRELENLSLRFRCPDRYDRIERLCKADAEEQREALEAFCARIVEILGDCGVGIRCEIRHRLPYSIYRQMQRTGRDFEHVDFRHIVRIIYDNPSPETLTDKQICLRIYSRLTDHFQEKPGSLTNYIDHPKENGYQSLHVRLLAEKGVWEEIHISSEQMVRRTKLGIILERLDEEGRIRSKDKSKGHKLEKDDRRWLNKFRTMLRELVEGKDDARFMDSVSSSLYDEDITVFGLDGRAVQLPQNATALDFAFEMGMGEHAQVARINGRLVSLQTALSPGDCIDIVTHATAHPEANWLSAAKTYKAQHYLRPYLARRPRPAHPRCEHCEPLPGQEVIGFVDAEGEIVVHRRDCSRAISLAAQRGDSIVGVDFPEHPDVTYEVKTRVRAIDRKNLLIDIVDSLSNGLQIPLAYIHAERCDNIVDLTLHYSVHSANELRTAVRFLATVDGVDEVYKI